MTLETIWTFVRNIIDISLVWLVIYYVLKSIRNNVKLIMLFKGILFIVVLKLISDFLGFVTIGLIIEYVIMWGPLALIIVFQPEIRNALEQLGRTQILNIRKTLNISQRERLVEEVVQAMDYLKRMRIGAIIVVERRINLNEYVEKSRKLNAKISSDLLVSIFFPKNPLHDGAVIIQGDLIAGAGAILPMSSNSKISKRLGTRHRAGLGISENTDAIVLIVSEETGRLSMAISGDLDYNLTLEDIKIMLTEELKPSKERYKNEVVEEGDSYE